MNRVRFTLTAPCWPRTPIATPAFVQTLIQTANQTQDPWFCEPFPLTAFPLARPARVAAVSRVTETADALLVPAQVAPRTMRPSGSEPTAEGFAEAGTPLTHDLQSLTPVRLAGKA